MIKYVAKEFFKKYQNDILPRHLLTQVQLDLAEIDLSQGAAQW